MECDDVDALLGAYVLDSLPRDQREALDAHLDTCDRHEDTDLLMAVARSLDPEIGPRRPSPDLQRRVIEAARTVRPPVDDA